MYVSPEITQLNKGLIAMATMCINARKMCVKGLNIYMDWNVSPFRYPTNKTVFIKEIFLESGASCYNVTSIFAEKGVKKTNR